MKFSGLCINACSVSLTKNLLTDRYCFVVGNESSLGWGGVGMGEGVLWFLNLLTLFFQSVLLDLGQSLFPWSQDTIFNEVPC